MRLPGNLAIYHLAPGWFILTEEGTEFKKKNQKYDGSLLISKIFDFIYFLKSKRKSVSLSSLSTISVYMLVLLNETEYFSF